MPQQGYVVYIRCTSFIEKLRVAIFLSSAKTIDIKLKSAILAFLALPTHLGIHSSVHQANKRRSLINGQPQIFICERNFRKKPTFGRWPFPCSKFLQVERNPFIRWDPWT